MRRKYLLMAIAVLLAAGGFWLIRTPKDAIEFDKSSKGLAGETPRGRNSVPNSAATLPKASRARPTAGPNSNTEPDHIPRPPDPARRFMDFTPEERVKFARKGHGPGG